MAKIKNYTSSVPVERTISYIEMELIKIGINHIEKVYKDGFPEKIIFSISLPDVKRLSFRIPANVDTTAEILKGVPQYKGFDREKLLAQARRTSWRLVYNWIEIQVAMVQLQQVDAVQVFLPYMYDQKTEKTFYEEIAKNNFRMLTTTAGK